MTDHSYQVVKASKEVVGTKVANGADKDHWPDMADRAWGETVFKYYGAKNYWE